MRPSIRTHLLDVTESGHLLELLYDDGENDEVVICAAHGGRIEPGTGELAIELAARLPNATCWARLGYDDDAEEFEQWHPPSSAIESDDHPLLDEIADRGFDIAISLHGMADEGLIVGGGVDADVKRRVADRLDAALDCEVETASEGPYAGVSPENFVNWLATGRRGGLQLELGPTVRDERADAIGVVLEDLVTSGGL